MKTNLFRAAIVAATLLCGLGGSVRADDVGPAVSPRKTPSGLDDRRRTTLVIEGRDLEREVVLELPRELKPGGAAAATSGPPAGRTIVAGLALSLAIATGGLWLARRRSPAARGIAASVAVTAVLAGAGGYALGNYSPFADADAKPGTLRQARPAGEPLEGEVRVLYSSDDGAVHLLIPKDVFHER